MALEPRILYDGAGIVAAVDIATSSPTPQTQVTTETSHISADNTLSTDSSHDGTTATKDSSIVASTTPEESTPTIKDTSTSSATAPSETVSATSESVKDSSVATTVPVATNTTSETLASTIVTADSTKDTTPVATSISSTTIDPTGKEGETVKNTDSTTSTITDKSSTYLTGGTTDITHKDTSALPTAATTIQLPLQTVPTTSITESPITQVVFVDSTVTDYQTLVNGIIKSTDNDPTDTNPTGSVGSSSYSLSGSVLVVTLGDTPIDDITAVLVQQKDLEAIHIVSHGDTGEIVLGQNHITEANLSQYQTNMGNWGNALADSGDILLYGCKVGADGEGQAFIEHVATVTKADVNASIDNTGNMSSGGNWDLEVKTGPIEVATVLNELNAGTWSGLLNQTNTGTWSITTNGSDATAINTTAGITTTITFTHESSNSSFNYSAAPTNNTLSNLTPGAFSWPDGTTSPNNSASLVATFDWDTTPDGSTTKASTDAGTGLITITFSEAVTNPLLHLDRLGGQGGTQNSSQLQLLTSGIGLIRIDGTDHFVVNGTTITTSQIDTPVSTNPAYSAETSNLVNAGTAAGSIMLEGTFTTVQFRISAAPNSNEGAGGDAFEMALTLSPINPPVVDLNSTSSTSTSTTTSSTNPINFGDFGSSTSNVAYPESWTETGTLSSSGTTGYVRDRKSVV